MKSAGGGKCGGLAVAAEEESVGLNHRRMRHDADAGMLLLYEGETAHRFWMRNTLIPLDMMFIAGDLRVAGVVENAEPQTDTPRQVDQPS